MKLLKTIFKKKMPCYICGKPGTKTINVSECLCDECQKRIAEEQANRENDTQEN